MNFDDLVERLGGVDHAGMARCPAHEDRSPSLSVTRGDEDKILLYCHAGCSVNAVLAAVGLTVKDLYERRNGQRGDDIVATYRYTDEDGALLFEVVRKTGKKFVCRKPDGAGGWTWKLGDTRRVLYRLPEVIAAVAAGQLVYIVEGEKDADRLHAENVVATCNPHGAGKWSRVPDAPSMLSGADVIVVVDRDEPGYAHGRDIARSLIGKATTITVVEPLVGKDVSDHLTAGHALEELQIVAGTDPGDPPLDVWLSLPPLQTATTQPPPGETPGEPPAIASEQRILDRFKVAVRASGVVGEETTACTLYLLLTSRLLDKPVSCAVKGHSSSGKSFTVEATLKFFPRAAYIEMTAMSERALVYNKEEYSHRTLVLFEVTALREGVEDSLVTYFIRSLLSEGRISYPVTVKDKEGNWTTKTIVKEGPTNMIVTTTKAKVHAENETRLLSLQTDDSREQTELVLRALADEDVHGADLRQWHELQTWLETAEHRVTIPYSSELAELIPPIAVRLRRDFGAVLALIRCHAILHQQTRSRDQSGRIVATIDDYAVVRDLVGEVVAAGVGATVSDTVRETISAVANIANPEGVTAAQVAASLKLDKSTASRRLWVAGSDGYLRNLETKRGRPGRWQIGDPLPENFDILPQPCNLTNYKPAG